MMLGVGQFPDVIAGGAIQAGVWAGAASIPSPAPSGSAPAWTTSEAQSWKCSLPFSSVLFDACKVPTPVDIQAEADRELAKIAAVNPDLAAAGKQAQIRAGMAYCASNPVECANYQTVVENPVLSAAIGPDLAGVANNLVSIADAAVGTVRQNWGGIVLLGAAVFGAVLLLKK